MTYVGQGQDDEDPNYIPTGGNLARNIVEYFPTFSTRRKTAMGFRRTRAGHCTPITFIPMINLTPSSETQEENWKRVWNPTCRVMRKKTSKRRHWMILCQPAEGDFVPIHSWERLHAPKKRKSQRQLVLTKFMLTNPEDAASVKTANTSTKSILLTQDTTPWVFTIWFICRYLLRKQYEFWKRGVGSGNRNGTHSNICPAWQYSKVRNTRSNRGRAKKKKSKTVHFSTLMDLRHLKNSELDTEFQKYKGRVVLRGDVVKDGSGSYAVSTEHRFLLHRTWLQPKYW